MLQLKIEGRELYDEKNNQFIKIAPLVLKMEHSLYTISLWESKWEKPFLSKFKKTYDEMLDYFRCMTMNEEPVDPMVYRTLSNENIEKIQKYLEAKMTATTISEEQSPGGGVLTSEIIYWEMFELKIPMECEHWHLNKLLMQIRVCDIKNQPKKKKGASASSINTRRAINEARRKAMGTNG